MKLSISLLAALHVSSSFVAAQPFVIFNTRVQDVLPTQALVPRQNLIDTINSALSADFGGGDASSTTLAPAVTRAPPAAASTTTSSKASKHTKSTSSDDDSQGPAATSSQSGSAATSSSSGSTSTSVSSTPTSTSTSTPAPHSTTTPAPTATLATSSTPIPSTNADGNNSTVPAGGVAVAVIMCLVIVAVTMFLIFRYNARCQAWWAAREDRLRQERSYRDAIDGPGSSSLRQQALSGGSSRRRTMLASFFAPSTARLSDNTEIRRKPVNWGAPAVPAVPKIPDAYSPAPQPEIEDEKLSLTASAAPLGQIERYSMIPVATQLPAPPLPPKPLPPPKPEHHTSPTFLPIPTSGSFVAELPACVPTTSPPQSRSISERQTQPTTLTRNLTNPHGFGGPLPATRYEPNPGPKTPTAPTHPMTLPVSPVSLHPNATSPNLGPVSPMSTYTTRSAGFDHSRSISTMTTSTTTSNSNARRESIPMLPPLPAIPGLIHAKRGSDGVFRLT